MPYGSELPPLPDPASKSPTTKVDWNNVATWAGRIVTILAAIAAALASSKASDKADAAAVQGQKNHDAITAVHKDVRAATTGVNPNWKPSTKE